MRKWASRTWQHPTIEEANRWLIRHGTELEKYMADILEDQLDDLLDDAALGGYPDPRVGQLYRRLDKAIYDAADDYGHQRGRKRSRRVD